MSALTLSAKANETGDGKVDYVPPASAAVRSPSTLPGAVGGVAISHDSPLSPKASASGTIGVGGSAPIVHSYASSRPSKQPSMGVFSNETTRPSNSSSAPRVTSSPLPSQSTITPGAVTSQLPSPKSSTNSRRSSMITADLSPYLARPAGIPMNGKRLKQLALLEAVADESSRMIASSSVPPTQPLPPHEVSHTPHHVPLSPNAVMSHNFTNLSPMYSNTHGPYIPSVPQTGPFNPPSPDNVFTVRPRTSNSFRPVSNYPPRSSNTRASMNQALLLGALSGTPNGHGVDVTM